MSDISQKKIVGRYTSQLSDLARYRNIIETKTK